MMAFVFLNWRGIVCGLLFGGLLALPIGYVKGKTAGKVAQLQGAVDAFKNRKDIDYATSNLGAYALCIELGGLPDECGQLRGVDKAPEGK